jgi:hypothetical protein
MDGLVLARLSSSTRLHVRALGLGIVVVEDLEGLGMLGLHSQANIAVAHLVGREDPQLPIRERLDQNRGSPGYSRSSPTPLAVARPPTWVDVAVSTADL